MLVLFLLRRWEQTRPRRGRRRRREIIITHPPAKGAFILLCHQEAEVQESSRAFAQVEEKSLSSQKEW